MDAECMAYGWSAGDCEEPGVGAIAEIGQAAPPEDLASTGAGPHLLTSVLVGVTLVLMGALVLARLRKARRAASASV